jgi:hypothetical protein
MRGLVKRLPAWRLSCGAALLCIASSVSAAEPEKGSTPPAASGTSGAKTDAGSSGPAESERSGSKASEPKETTEGDAKKPKDGQAEKPQESEANPPGEKASDQGPPSGEEGEHSGAARLKDLIGDGFLIRTTVFVPADAVTRQTGKISSDAVVLTLQKETTIAVCYYTLKAYVNGRKGLTKIGSCTVYQ